ncbi:MAG TPA: fimbria/pilus outer membrane usher protein, partial [Salinisphaeraceae bacterium]|nr:fimbria/pilus outer membrane usher protein [Salinisphaeraceae bacterium]
ADWSASLGVVRRNYGLSSFDYAADPAVSGSWRYGLSDSLTVQAHGEAIVGLAAAGAGAALRLGRAGVLHGSAAYSSNRAGSGALGNIGYNWRRGRFNFALDSTRTKDEWRDVAARYGSLPPRVSERALVGISSELAGSFSLSYLRLRYPGHDDSRYANAFWSRAFGPLSLSLSLNQNLDRHSDRSVFFGISMSLDRGLHVGSSVQRSHDRTRFSVNASQPIPGDGGFGWRAQAQTGRHNSGGMAEAGYLGRYGELRGGVRRHNHNSLVYGNLSGSLVRMGDHTFAARRVDNAFAVVSTDGIAGVPVKLENRVIGHTNAAGMLLVSRLNAWQQNKLAIDPMDLPANVRIDRVSTFATPRDSAGTLVEFGIREIRAASIVLVDETGAPLPVGSRVQTAGPGARSSAVVGYDGIVYLDALQDHNLLTVHTDAGPCRVAFDFAGSGEIVPQIGPFTCQPEAET